MLGESLCPGCGVRLVFMIAPRTYAAQSFALS